MKISSPKEHQRADIPCSLFAAHSIKQLLYRVPWYEPIGLVGVTLLLALSAVASGFVPAAALPASSHASSAGRVVSVQKPQLLDMFIARRLPVWCRIEGEQQ
jgi:hypothetical protein